MRGGKSIWLIAGAIFMAAFFWPTWEWWYTAQLDKLAATPPTVAGKVAEVVQMIAPIQQFLFGISFGMILAFSIGYWPQITGGARRAFHWVKSVSWLWWNTLPGRRRLSYGMSWLAENELHKRVAVGFAVDMWTVEVRWWPHADFYCNFVEPDMMSIARSNRRETEKVLVRYEIWGRRRFWATLKKWRDTDYIGLHEAFDRMKAEVAAAEKAAKVATP